MKHTPGPWKASGLYIIAEPVGHGKWPNMIGQTTQNLNAEPYHHSHEEACANARLIEACKMLLEQLQEDYSEQKGDRWQFAVDAIRKATE